MNDDAHEPASGGWQESILGCTDACKCCGSDLHAQAYCSNCGQRRIEARLGIWEIIQETAVRVFNWETGLLRTLRIGMFQTGTLARRFCSGYRKPYVNPLAFFFLAATLQLVSLWLAEDKMRGLFISRFGGNEQARQDSKLFELIGGDVPSTLADLYIQVMQQGYTYVALLSFCLPFALLLKWLHGFLGNRFRLGETLTFSLYTIGICLVITAFTTQIALVVSTTLASVLGPIVYLIMGYRAHTNFFPSGAGSRAMTLLALGVSCAIFAGSLVGLFTISLAIKIAAAAA